ncbi:hypothetical protein BN1200_750003 [Klebsiella variicola]|nr:hypothetical protein BN1200_750003 [Klebsiella variicola]
MSVAEVVQYINDISKIAAKNFTIELLSSVQNKMKNMTLPSEAMTSFKDQLDKKFHIALTDVFATRQPSDFQGAWFLLNSSSVSLLKIL